LPNWGAYLGDIDFDNIKYFVRSTEKQATSWEELPDEIKNTYDRLGIPEAEKKRLIAGVAAQYESEVVYHQIREDLEKDGVLFLDTDTALREHEDVFKEYFGSVIPSGDNKFSALNTAVWSGGSFFLALMSRTTSSVRPRLAFLPASFLSCQPNSYVPIPSNSGRAIVIFSPCVGLRMRLLFLAKC